MSRTHTTTWKVEDHASQALEAIKRSATAAHDSLGEGIKIAERYSKETRAGGKAFDEVGDKIRDARNKMLEYGFTQEQIRAGLKLMTSTAQELNEPISKTALRLEELAIETQDADTAFRLWTSSVEASRAGIMRQEEAVALVVDRHKAGLPVFKHWNEATKLAAKLQIPLADAVKMMDDRVKNALPAVVNLTKAEELAAKQGIALKDSITQLDDAAKGGTQGLRNLSNQGRRTADAIDRIGDPLVRARESQRALNREMNRAPTIIDKLQTKYQVLNVRLAEMGPLGHVVKGGFLAIAGGAAAAGTAVVGFVAGSMRRYMEKTPEAKAKTDALKKSMEDLQMAVGKTAVEMTGLETQTDKMTIRMDALTKAAADPALGGWVDTIAEGGELLAHIHPLTALWAGALWAVSTAAGDAENALIGTNAQLQRMKNLQKDLADADADALIKTIKKDDALKKATQTERKNRAALHKQKKQDAELDRMIAENAADRAEKAAKQAKKKPKGGGGGGGGGKVRRLTPEEIEAAHALRDQFIDAMSLAGARDAVRADAAGFAGGFDLAASIRAEREAAEAEFMRMEALRDQYADGASSMRGTILGMDDEGHTAQILEFRDAADLAALQVERNIELMQAYDGALTGVVNGGMSLMIDATLDMVEGLAAGDLSLKKIGVGLMASFGDLLKKTGAGMVLLGTALASVDGGVPSPLALIGTGAAMAIAGAALSGFARRATGGGGAGSAGVAGAVQRGFASAQDRFADRGGPQEMHFTLLLDGFEQAVARSVRKGAETRNIPQLMAA